MSILNQLQSYRVDQLPRRMEKFQGEQKNVTRFHDFFILFYHYDFVVGLLQGFIIKGDRKLYFCKYWGLLAGILPEL